MEENNEEIKLDLGAKVKQSMYYFIIGIISFIALVFLPMIGSSVGLGWNIPDTTVGWIVWIAVKIIVAAINVLIFHSFMQQAKLNIKDNPSYVEARDILVKVKVKNVIPRSPKSWNFQQYMKKGTTIFFTTGLATIALTQALLTFDWMSMLTYLFTIIMGLIFGVLQMKSAEEYWTDEYYRYALMVKEEKEKSEREAEAKRALEMAQEERNKQTNVYLDNVERGHFLGTRVDKRIVSPDMEPVDVDYSDTNKCFLGGTVHPSCTITNSVSPYTEEELDAIYAETVEEIKNKKGDEQC